MGTKASKICVKDHSSNILKCYITETANIKQLVK